MKNLLVLSFLLISYSSRAQFQNLYNFNNVNPILGVCGTGHLTISGNSMYGMTTYGGKYYCTIPNGTNTKVGFGVIFKINTDGSGYDTLISFNTPIGIYPNGSLTLSGNVLYGMTSVMDLPNNQGVVFKINTDGSGFDTLMSFHGANGSSPQGNLTLVGNVLYGMTTSGGKYNAGNIFKINTDGSGFDTLLNFNVANGYDPNGSLIFSGNVLYGMAEGGKYNDGFIFKINTDGSGFDTLLNFNGTNGNGPIGTLSLSGNVFYGMTVNGGKYNDGVIFKVNMDGSGYDTLMSYNVAKGYGPSESLTVYNNALYGISGVRGDDIFGPTSNGTLFKINTNGSGFDPLMNFTNAVGETPAGALILNGNVLYGMTRSAIFKFTNNCTPATYNDTITYNVSDNNFIKSSPQTYFANTKYLNTNLGCDSTVNQYITYKYYAKSYTDTIMDTIKILSTLNDTIYTTIEDTLKINVTLTDLNPPLNLNLVKAYPNPTNSVLYINTGNYSEMANYQLIIYDNSGKAVWRTTVTQQLYSIDLNSLGGKGLFILQIIDSNSTVLEVRKILLD